MKKEFWGVILLLLVACKPEENSKIVNFDRGPLLAQAADELIIPSLESFVEATVFLEESADQFVESPSSESLASLKSSWLSARIAWKACEPFKFGPVDSYGFENAFDLWPANTSGIETAVSKYDGSDNYLVQIGSDKRGLSAIEYLLYAEDEASTLAAFEDTNRQSYLQLLAADLTENGTSILDSWTDGYADTFKAATGNDAAASATLLVNELLYQIEVSKNYRIATPLGTRTGSSDPLLDQLESPYAEVSKELLIASLEAAQNVFTGGSGQGFDDYLDAVGILNEDNKLLSEEILEQFELCFTDINAIEGSLKEALETDKELVSTVYVDLTNLTLLMKVDMMSQTGLLVLYSDNDGD